MIKKKSNKILNVAIGFVVLSVLSGGSFYAYKVFKGKSSNANNLNSENPQTLAQLLRTSIEGLGTDEVLLFKSIADMKTKEVWLKVQIAYETQYGTDLSEDLRLELTSKEFQKLVELIDALA